MGDFQCCIELILAEEGGLALGASDISAGVGAEIAPGPCYRAASINSISFFNSSLTSWPTSTPLALVRATR